MTETRTEPYLVQPVKVLDTLTAREQELLRHNKRLRDALATIADAVKPKWRESGYSLEAGWILEEIHILEQDRLHLERGMGNLLEVVALRERKSNGA